MELIEQHASSGGWQNVYRHYSQSLNCEMNFGVYLPPKAVTEKLPVLYWLSGLTCTEQNFITKSGMQHYAAHITSSLLSRIPVPGVIMSRMPTVTILARGRFLSERDGTAVECSLQDV